MIDSAECYSIQQVRRVLVHEMCHAVREPFSRPHGIRFFQQVERMLEFGVPVAVDFLSIDEPDADMVQATLPRCAALRRRREASLAR